MSGSVSLGFIFLIAVLPYQFAIKTKAAKTSRFALNRYLLLSKKNTALQLNWFWVWA